MIKTIESFLSKYNIGDEPIIVGVSGGRDSMALLHALFQIKKHIIAVHVNYNLRGDDSQLDRDLVKQYCAEKNIPIEILEVAEKPMGNLQDWARDIRKSFYEEVKERHHARWIALAHHAEDLRGSQWLKFLRLSVNGLMGMKQINGNIIRPFLLTSRTEIEKFVQDHQIPFRDDQSNFDSKYNRNWLRTQLIPATADRFPTSLEAHIDFQKKMENQQMWIDWMAEKWLEENLNNSAGQTVELNSQDIPQSLPAAWILYKWLSHYQFNSNEIDAAAQLPYMQVGSKIENQQYTVWFHQGKWMLNPKSTAHEEALHIDQLPYYLLDEVEWIFEQVAQVNPGLYGLSNTHQLDLSKLTPPLMLRKYKTGDDFQPLGMQGKMKMSDFLNKKGIPAMQKKQFWILDTGHGIAAVLGLQIADWCKVSDDTRDVMVIRHHHPTIS